LYSIASKRALILDTNALFFPLKGYFKQPPIDVWNLNVLQGLPASPTIYPSESACFDFEKNKMIL